MVEPASPEEAASAAEEVRSGHEVVAAARASRVGEAEMGGTVAAEAHAGEITALEAEPEVAEEGSLAALGRATDAEGSGDEDEDPEAWLIREVVSAREALQPLSVVALDDGGVRRHSHVALVREALATLRPSGADARRMGDASPLVVVLPGVRAAPAAGYARAVIARVAAMEPGAAAWGVGVAAFPREARTSTDLYRVAQQRAAADRRHHLAAGDDADRALGAELNERAGSPSRSAEAYEGGGPTR